MVQTASGTTSIHDKGIDLQSFSTVEVKLQEMFTSQNYILYTDRQTRQMETFDLRENKNLHLIKYPHTVPLFLYFHREQPVTN